MIKSKMIKRDYNPWAYIRHFTVSFYREAMTLKEFIYFSNANHWFGRVMKSYAYRNHVGVAETS